MQCNIGKIKEEEDGEMTQTVFLNDLATVQHSSSLSPLSHLQPASSSTISSQQQKVILSPRIEIHRIYKNQSHDDELTNIAPTSPVLDTIKSQSSMQHHQFISPNSRPVSHTNTYREQRHEMQHSHQQHQSQQMSQQRVHVIKDGRYYEEPRSHFKETQQHQHSEQGIDHASISPPPSLLPPILSTTHHSPTLQMHTNANKVTETTTNSKQRIVTNRQIIVNPTTTTSSSSNGNSRDPTVNVVFRPPVVSSSCQPMRPPPPPPPPKIKCTPSEEPSSSIPDLGK